MKQHRLSTRRFLTVLASMIAFSVALYIVAFVAVLVYAMISGGGLGP